MTRIGKWILSVVMMIAAVPSYAGEATQMWRCELHDDATEEQVMEAAQNLLAAARTMKGGENLEAYVYFPVAVAATGEIDMLFVVRTPTFSEWGEFWDEFKGSPVAELDKKQREFVVPTDSGLWESVRVKVPGGTDAPAGKCTQMWKCELHDDATEEQVMAAAEKWLAAARTMKGGQNLVAYVYFPVAVNDSGESDLMFVVSAPTFKEWGQFWDAFKGSPAAALDKKHREFIVAPDSAVWESIKVETKK